jgi:predicted RNA-binding Zn ribbon-like protein
MDRWLELVNRTFAGPDELAAWAAEAGFGYVGLQGGDEAVALAARMQEALRDLAGALVELAGVAFGVEAPPIVQVPVQLGIEGADFALDPEGQRLARCQRDDPPCGRFFIDRSRDGRGRWCSAACGTVERVRKLRSKDA